jgi:Phosphodiester glycosidase
MTLTTKNPLSASRDTIKSSPMGRQYQRVRSINSCLQSKTQPVMTKLYLVMIELYLLLLVFPQVAIAESSNYRVNSPKNSSTQNQACSQNLDILRLVNISEELSNWLKKPDAAIEFVSQQVTLTTLFNVNKLGNDFAKSGFYRLIIDSIVPLEVAIAQKPISIYLQALQQQILPIFRPDFNFRNPVQLARTTINNVSLILISGGQPITIHADSRYQVPEIIAKSGTNAIAAVDGTFFSLKYLKSNTMIGPVMSQITNKFVPGNNSENKKLAGRPLVLISPQKASYIPFEPDKHNTLPGIQAEMPDVTDAFVAGAWLVKDGKNLPRASYKTLYGADVARHRAFWGISKVGVPTVGVSTKPVDSANLGIILVKAGLQDAVMLDSGASTSLAFQGQSLVPYTPRPVPHAIALLPSGSRVNLSCTILSKIVAKGIASHEN